MRGEFVELLFIKHLSFFKTLLHVAAQYEISAKEILPYAPHLLRLLLKRDIGEMTAYGISYNTINPQGEQTLASGVIYMPRKKKPKGVIEVSPLTRSKLDCATRDIMAAEIFPGMIGYITIIPDLIGCGSSSQHPIAYMQHDNVANVSADMRKAAAQFLQEQYNYQIPNSSLLFGYSLGGSGIWALARHYQQHPELNIHVTHIFAGGGAYYPEVALKAFHASRYSDYAILPNIIYSMNHYNHLNLNFDNIFKGQLKKNYHQWCNGNIPIPELTQMIGTQLDNYLNFDFFSEQNPDYIRLMEVVTEKTIPEDWIPTAEVHLYHSRNDTYVPIACFWELYKRLKSCNANVSYKLIDHDHIPAAVTIELDFIAFLLNLNSETH